MAGVGRGPFEALAPVLDRQKLEVVKVASPEMSVELARSEPFDLVIFDAEVKEGSLENVVDSIRDGMSASRNTSILVLARPGNVDAARELVSRGVNRVMLLDDPPEVIGQQLEKILKDEKIKLLSQTQTKIKIKQLGRVGPFFEKRGRFCKKIPAGEKEDLAEEIELLKTKNSLSTEEMAWLAFIYKLEGEYDFFNLAFA